MSGPYQNAGTHKYGSRRHEEPDDQQGFAEGNQEYDGKGPSGMGREEIQIGLNIVHAGWSLNPVTVFRKAA